MKNQKKVGSAFVASLLVSGLVGCAANPGSGTTSTPVTAPSGPYQYISGNWEFKPTPTTAKVPFTLLAGYVDEFNNNPGVSDFATASLQVRSTTCYTDQSTIPLTAGVTPTHAGFQSFPIDLQVLDIGVDKNSTVTQLTGNYSISGGCGDGAAGTITGQLYSALSGQYSGVVINSAGRSLQLTLAQYAEGTSDGRSFVTGSAVFNGFSCFTSGSLVSPNGWVLGSSLSLTFNTNEPGASQVVLTGTFDPAADTLTLSSVVVAGGSCATSLGTATLTH